MLFRSMKSHVFIYDRGELYSGGHRHIANFRTKMHWRDKSKLTDITNGVCELLDKLPLFKIKSVALSALGCGLGGLDWIDFKRFCLDSWSVVQPEVKVLVYAPRGEK